MKVFFLRVVIFFVSLLVLGSVSFATPVDDLLASGHLNEAVAARATRGDPESLNVLSRAYYAMDCWEDAVKYGERAVNLEPNNAEYHLWLARAYGRKAEDSKALAAASNARKAKNEFERAVQLDPSNVQARVDLAQYYTEAPAIMGGGVDKARDQAAQVQRYDLGMAHLILARVAEKQKQYADAEAQYRAAIQQAKNPADMWLQLADFYRRQGRPDDMQGAVQSAMAQPKKLAESYFDAARELFEGGRDYPDAVRYLQRYLASGELTESAPAFRAHYLIGQLNERMGQNSAAASEYQASVKLASAFVPATEALSHLAR